MFVRREKIQKMMRWRIETIPSKTRLRAASHSKKRVLPTNGQLKPLRSYSKVRLETFFLNCLKNINCWTFLKTWIILKIPNIFWNSLHFHKYTTKYETLKIHNFISKHKPFIITWTCFEFVFLMKHILNIQNNFWKCVSWHYSEFANISLKHEYFSYLEIF